MPRFALPLFTTTMEFENTPTLVTFNPNLLYNKQQTYTAYIYTNVLRWLRCTNFTIVPCYSQYSDGETAEQSKLYNQMVKIKTVNSRQA
jgi:hypothetical protein